MSSLTPSESANPADDLVSRELAAAQTQIRAGRAIRARRHLRRVLELDARNLEAILLLAGAAADRGRASETGEWLGQARQIAPHDVRVQLASAQHGLVQSQLGMALEQFELAAAQDQSNPEIIGGLALTYQHLGRLDEADQYYQRAIDLAPDDARFHYNRGTLRKLQHEFSGAMDMYRRAVTLAPYDKNYRLRLSVALIENGEFREATEHLDVLAMQDPRDSSCAYYQGYAHMKLSEGTRASSAAKRYHDIVGTTVSAMTTMACTHLCAGEPQTALECCEQALQLGPGNRQALSDYAIALASTDQIRRARQIFDTDNLLWPHKPPTPSGYSSISAFNAELVSHIKSHPGLDFSRLSLSCHEGATSTELITEPLGPVAPLRDMILEAAAQYRNQLPVDPDHPYLGQLPKDLDGLELTAWATILRNHGYQHGHIHATAWISGVYYVSLPDVIGAQPDDDQGFIEFGRAPYYYPATHQGRIVTIKPEAGLMVLFPSYFYHRTVPFSADANRITVAFDLRLPGTGADARSAQIRRPAVPASLTSG